MMMNKLQENEQYLPEYHKPKAICEESERKQSTIECGDEEPRNSLDQLLT